MTPCVVSPYAIGSSGYCYIRHEGKPVGHHRYVYALTHGLTVKELAGKVVMHKCDNPTCVNPDHLELGTHADNIKDMRAKGRNKDIGCSQPGESNGVSKLTDQVVLAIRADRLHTGRELAAMYNVTPSTISYVLNRKIWTHI